jgi:prophage regulatory protein
MSSRTIGAAGLAYLSSHPSGQQILRLPAVIAITGLSRSSIYRLMKDEECPFPRPVRVGKRAIGWPLEQVQRYLVRRPEASIATSPKAGA